MDESGIAGATGVTGATMLVHSPGLLRVDDCEHAWPLEQTTANTPITMPNVTRTNTRCLRGIEFIEITCK